MSYYFVRPQHILVAMSVPLTYNGRNCGSCDNFNTARYFLMKLNKWIDGKVEIMHILSFC